MEKSFISVLIPTKDRAELLGAAIRSCLVQNYDDCQFIVSDNASSDHTRDVVHGFNDPRLRYVNPGRRLSMADNFEFALSHAAPGYVLSIGDDDALMPDALEYLGVLVGETAARAIAGPLNFYHWDNQPIDALRNTLYLCLGSGFTVKNSRKEVRRTLGFNYSYVHKLPGIYYGLISTRLVEKLSCNGRFFHSMTPDAYSALACALATEDFVYSHKPFILAGVSGRSTGASQLSSTNSPEISRFFQENTHKFHESLVYCPAQAMMIAEAFLQLRSIHPQLTEGIEFSIREMCTAALREANANTRSAIETAVSEMSKRNGVSFEQLKKASRMPPVRALLSKEVDEFLLPHLFVQSSVSEIPDVAAAAVYADRVTRALVGRRNRNWANNFVQRISRKLRARLVR
ncbi:MAG: glycosyltransferase family A protein [Nevskia sp.]|nr:glycosyltransferase family A protein [Nevskia sp.]